MKKRKICVFGLALALALLTGCSPATEEETRDKYAEESLETSEETPMFTDPDQAFEQLEKLCGVYRNPDIMESEGYERFMELSAEASELLAQKTTDEAANRAPTLAEELTQAYDALDYQRGDTPRIYLNTYVPTLNYAKGAEIVATSEPSSDAPASMAADGDAKTYWTSDENEEQTLTLDMGRVREIGYVCVEWGKGAAKRYEIDVSEDGKNWETLLTVEDGAKYKTQGFELDDSTAGRYLRVRMLTASSSPYYLEEITVAEKKPERAAVLTKEYQEIEAVIVDREGGTYPTIEDTVKIKIRGNSTANTEKNPYNIKFSKKKTILGMKGTKKWSLLANLFDKSQLRNKLASDFAAMVGVTPELKSAFVEVYLDGVYQGVYLLTMPVTDGTVDIDVEKGEMLLERNGYYNTELAGVNYNYTPITGIRFVPIAPEKGTETEEQKQAIQNLLKEAEYAAVSGERKRVESIFDVESFVNMYICEELMKDIDIFHGSTYFYYKNGRLYSGPIWDMDLSMGNVSMAEGAIDEKYAKYYNLPWNGSKTGNGTVGDSTTGNWATVDFYKPLMENMWFRDLVKERYMELIPLIESLYADGGVIDGYVEEYGDAFLRNYELGGYSLTKKYFSCEYDSPSENYEDSVTYLKEWLRARDAWIREDLKIK